ncbi:MAG: UDP-N-acetylglucosamine 2-epimerase (non-hydrolyzing) [Flavobacteriales bacterium]|nr:UDP-N-acetylglucosamine 2-epimerase (non-hydrolyzing) [Flavobacteriales bacterium]
MTKPVALFIFGTRPEGIKMAPIIKAFRASDLFDTRVCITAQHREMLDSVMEFFDIEVDYDLDVMKPNQNLISLTGDILLGLRKVMDDLKPRYVFVQGDTTTTMAGAIAGLYAQAQVCHVEAGLRTWNKWAPFPEESNRCMTGAIADWHFPPTTTSEQNLLRENVDPAKVIVTGNTVIDALIEGLDIVKKSPDTEEIAEIKFKVNFSKKVILVTGHRRENHGQGFINICKALRQIADSEDVEIVYPVHLNPNVQGPVYEYLSDCQNIHLIKPLSYSSFIWLMDMCNIILTDSGGVQEEAPSLGKPVLVMRETTERPEAVEAGTVILVGIDVQKIVSETKDLLHNTTRYDQMSRLINPYGDGQASARILQFISELEEARTNNQVIYS